MTSARAAAVADAAIDVIAARGMRGLTHRAVDEAAGLPVGSTSNLARTRAALLDLTLRRLAELEASEFEIPQALSATAGLDQDAAAATLATAVTRALHAALTTEHRRLTTARFELALEATRRPELRRLYDRLGQGFHLMVVDLLARAGSRRPATDARVLTSACEGILFHNIAGAGAARPADPGELRAAVTALVSTLTTGRLDALPWPLP